MSCRHTYSEVHNVAGQGRKMSDGGQDYGNIFFLLHAVMSRETEVTYSKDMFLVNYFFASRRVTTLLTDFNFHRIGEWRNVREKNLL